MCSEISKIIKNKNTIKGNVTTFKHCDDIWIFYCTNVTLNLEKTKLTIPKLKIIALDEKLKKKNNKSGNKYMSNEVGEG